MATPVFPQARPIQSRVVRTAIVGLALVSSALYAVAGNGSGDASAILASYARSSGLATVLCAADQAPAQLVLDLARKGLAVHVLVAKESTRDGLVKAMGDQAGSDAVMIERIALSALPYLDNFVDLIVIDNPKQLGKLGLARAEIERVVTPGGLIASPGKGGWQFSRKAWPNNMDNWTHPNYDATNNRVSKDKALSTPFGYKWIDGMGVPPPQGSVTRGWVVSDGRLFTVGSSEPENFGLRGSRADSAAEYLVARSAFNGLVLWKVRLGRPADRPFWSRFKGAALIKVAPIAVDSRAVYAVHKDSLAAFDPATGKLLYTCANEYAPWAVRVSNGTIVTAGFAPGVDSGKGGIEAFDAANGTKRWSAERTAAAIAASGSEVFVQIRGQTAEESSVLALDLVTGAELFTLSGDGDIKARPRLLSCGNGYVLVNRKFAVTCLEPRTGKKLWQLDSVPYFWGPVIDGELWIDGGAYNVLTGKKVRDIPKMLFGEGWSLDDDGDDFGCVAMGMAGNLMLSGRHHRYQRVGEDSLELYYYRGLRAGCGPSMVAANGMAYVPQVNCICNPTHPLGFTAVAPVSPDPSPAEFAASPEVVRGAAFGSLSTDAKHAWPMYRGNEFRSAASALPSVYNFTPRWETKVLSRQPEGVLGDSRVSRGMSAMSAPVCGMGMVFVTAADRGEVVALDERTGAIKWRYRAGSRIETSPSLYGNGCFFGSNDGYVYALNANDGSLMWRSRVAPREQRIMDHGIVESRWPVYGSVLVYRGAIYAAAGKNSEVDGGVVIVALDPATGARRWTRHLDVYQGAKNDLLRVQDGRIVWQSIDLDPATGEGDLRKGRVFLTEDHTIRSGMWDNTYLASPASRRVGKTFTVDNRNGWLMAWNSEYLVNENGAIIRRDSDTATKMETGAERKRLFYDIAKQPTAIAVCAKSVLLGYSDSARTRGNVIVSTLTGERVADFSFPSAVAHNGIAVSETGIVVCLENGSVAFLANAPVLAKNAGFITRVNCGGKEFKDSKGNTWLADQPYEPGKWGRVGGGGYDRTKDIGRLVEIQFRQVAQAMRRTVPGPDALLYHTELSGLSSYRFTVPNGRYAVVLHFAETYFFNDMMLPNGDLSWVHRRFDVSLNGAKILDDFEPVAHTGGVSHVPLVKRFETDVADGDITIGFTSLENSSIINAIEIIAIDGAI